MKSGATAVFYAFTVPSTRRAQCAIESQQPEVEAMPLRDHFHAPLINRYAWEGFHAAWPTMLVIRLGAHLPDGYAAEPRAHIGTSYEIDVGAFELVGTGDSADIGEQYEYEVLIFDHNREERQLVAAVEFVSPANKDRPDHRREFVAKCAALLQKNVCVAIVDLVTTRRANLYAELLELIDRSDPALGMKSPSLYAATCRTRTARRKPKLDSWTYPMKLGQPLPELPLCLSEDLTVPLELEASYEDTCRILRIA